jgi:hypothetical protein
MFSDDPFRLTPSILPAGGKLAEEIRRLETERQNYAAAMAEIDRILQRIDATLKERRPVSAPRGSTPVGLHSPDPDKADLASETERRRGRFKQTAVTSILEFIGRCVNPSTAEINAHWRAEGRKGTVNVTLLKLLKQGLILRQSDPAVRGSRYVLAKESEGSPGGKI